MSPSCTLIVGKKIEQEIKDEISLHVKRSKEAGKKIPHLAIILAGDDIASQTHVNNKIKACKAGGFHYTMVRCAHAISEKKLMEHIARVNADPGVVGFMVQLPLPPSISMERI